MSAIDFKNYVLQVIDTNIHGDGQEIASIGLPILNGECVSFEDYKDRTGYLRGLNTARSMVESAFKQMFDPDPEPEKK